MKQIVLVSCLLFVLLTAACAKPNVIELKEGTYQLNGDMRGPYITFDQGKKEWRSGGDIAMSYAIFGTYEIDGAELSLTAKEIPQEIVLTQDAAGNLRISSLSDTSLWLKEGQVFKFWDPKK